MMLMMSAGEDVVGDEWSYCACNMPGKVGIVYREERGQNKCCSVELENLNPHGNVMQELFGVAGIRGRAHVYFVWR